MDAGWIIAIVVASVSMAALLGWLIWRGARRGASTARRVVETRADEQGVSLGGTLPPLLLDPVHTVTSWVEAVKPQLLPALASDGTITLVFSDVEGSTALNHAIGDARFAAVLRAHERRARRLVRQHDGRLVKSQGDGLMLAFKRPDDAVRFAVAFQRELAAAEDGVPLAVRIGIHTGAAQTRQGDFFGANVAFAARVCSEASGGEVLVSAAVHERTADDDSLRLRRGPKANLRGIPGRHRLYVVEWSVSR